MARLSQEVRQAVATRPRRATDPGFSLQRMRRVLLTNDSGFAEVLCGVWLMALRGLMLFHMGWTFAAVGEVMASIGLTYERVGTLLVLVGVSQVVAAGTCYHRLRAAVAFIGALVCLIVLLAYLGAGRIEEVQAWTWAAVMAAEACLSWRVLLSRVALLDQLHRDQG